MGSIVWAASTWIVLAGFYLFLAGSLDTVELVAATVCASGGLALAAVLSHVGREHFSLRPAPRAVFRPLAALLPDFAAVGRELLVVAVRGAGGRHRGAFVHQPFDFGGATARDAGRRALTTVGLSLAPRGLLVRGERSRGALLLHCLPARPASPDETWPA